MNVLILAGGFGKRLAHIAGDKPKVLVEVAGVPILERQIRRLHEYGFRNLRLSLHHKADQIIDFCNARWPRQIEYAIESEPLGTGGGIKFATRDWTEPFMVINGDILTDLDLTAFAATEPHTICCAFRNDARTLGLVDVEENGRVRGFREKPIEPVAGYINAGFYVLDKGAFDYTTGDSFMMEYDVFPRLADTGRLSAFVHHGYWIDVGTEERLRQAHEHFANEQSAYAHHA